MTEETIADVLARVKTSGVSGMRLRWKNDAKRLAETVEWLLGVRDQWEICTRERDEARAERDGILADAIHKQEIDRAENAALRGQLFLHGHAVEIGDDSLGVEWLAREKRLQAVARASYDVTSNRHASLQAAKDALQDGDLGETP